MLQPDPDGWRLRMYAVAMAVAAVAEEVLPVLQNEPAAAVTTQPRMLATARCRTHADDGEMLRRMRAVVRCCTLPVEVGRGHTQVVVLHNRTEQMVARRAGRDAGTVHALESSRRKVMIVSRPREPRAGSGCCKGWGRTGSWNSCGSGDCGAAA